jgi:hypothetical protein
MPKEANEGCGQVDLKDARLLLLLALVREVDGCAEATTIYDERVCIVEIG